MIIIMLVQRKSLNKVGAPVDQYGTARIDLFDLPEDHAEETALCQIFAHPDFRLFSTSFKG